MNRPTPESSSNLLIVEGGDDKYVAIQMAIRFGSIPPFNVLERGSVENLLKSIPFDVRTPGYETIGFLLDADDYPSNRWDAVSNRLRSAGIDAPSTPNLAGTIIDATDDVPRIGVWMMHNNQSRGELEDFVETMIPDGDPVWPYSQDYIDGIPTGDRKFTSGKILRAKIHAWLDRVPTRDTPTCDSKSRPLTAHTFSCHNPLRSRKYLTRPHYRKTA